MSLNLKSLIFSGLAALAAVPAFSGTYFANTTAFTFISFDFSSVSFAPGHLNWNMWTEPTSGSAGTRYVDIELNGKPLGGGQCYEMRVSGGPGTANPDIQMFSQAGVLSIDDDGPGGSRTPLARLWITSSFNVRLSAYSSASNDVDFGVNSYLITATTAAQCDNGSYPFYNMSTNTVLRANSTAN
jgi:hypothetical protein